MSRYIIRLDDASDYMDGQKWERVERLLDLFNIKPLVGIIPDNQDPMLAQVYPCDALFWDKVMNWKAKGWKLALHGCEHRYITKDGGINPVNARSEFAGVPLEKQCEKIRKGLQIFRRHGIEPTVFFAPSHTFDENTIIALKRESKIRVISDTIANSPYCREGMTFVPQQSGRVRPLHLDTVTFCYHPNGMSESDFDTLESFLKLYSDKFVGFPDDEVTRSAGVIDKLLMYLYFARRK